MPQGVNEAYNINIKAKLDKSMAKLKRFENRIKKIGLAVAKVTAAIKAMAAAVTLMLTAGLYAAKKLLDVMDDTIKKARSLSLSSKAWQKLTFAFEQSGISADVAQKSIFNLQKQIGKAGRGEKIYADALGSIGLSYEQLIEHSPDKQLALVIDGLKGIKDPALRAAIANDLLGRSAKDLGTLMKSGSVGIEELMQQATDFGIVMEKSVLIQAEKSNDAINLLWKTIRAQFARGLGETDFVEKWALGLAKFVAKFPANMAILKDHLAAFDILDPFKSWNGSIKDALKGIGADKIAKVFSAVVVYKAVKGLAKFLGKRMLLAVAASFSTGGAVGGAISAMMTWFGTIMTATVAASFSLGTILKGAITRMVLYMGAAMTTAVAASFGLGPLLKGNIARIGVAAGASVGAGVAAPFLVGGSVYVAILAAFTAAAYWLSNNPPKWYSDFKTAESNPDVLSDDERDQLNDIVPGGYASGGQVSGKGSGTSDSILARLSNGEYVVNAKAAKKNYGLLEAINKGLPGFATGGGVNIDRAGLSAATGISDAKMLDYLIKNGGYTLERLVEGFNDLTAQGIPATNTIELIKNKTKALTEQYKDLVAKGLDPAIEGFFKDDEKKNIVSTLSASISNAINTGDWSSVKDTFFRTLSGIFAKRGQENLEKLLTPIVDSISNALGNALSGIGGSGGSDLSGLISSGIDFISGWFAKGGIVPKPGQRPQYFANGGYAKGKDTVPAMLTPGEMVLTKEQQGMMGGTTNNITINVEGNVDQRSIDQIKRVIGANPQDIYSSSAHGQRGESGLRSR